MRRLEATCLLASFVLCNSTFIVHASEGDRDPQFRQCTKQCGLRRLQACGEAGSGDCLARPLYLGLLGWNDASECQYECMWAVSQLRQAQGLPVVKFFGKWPFRRVAGIQEICASFFSFLNLLPHFLYLVRPSWPSEHPLCGTLRMYSLVGVNAWLWATVFHARDLRWTELMDYFSAILGIAYLLWAVIHRLLAPYTSSMKPRKGLVVFSGILVGCFYAYHVRIMLAHFDYGYNMKVGVGMALLADIGWLIYFWRIRMRPYVHRMALTFVVLNASILLELFDFPPLGGFLDAHASWHMSTVPTVFVWYRYLSKDLQWDMAEAEGKNIN